MGSHRNKTHYPITSPSDPSLATSTSTPQESQQPHAHTNGHSPEDDQYTPPPSGDPSRRRRSQKHNTYNSSADPQDLNANPQDLEVLFLHSQVDALKKELEAERRTRADEIKNIQRSLQRVYSDCAALTSREAEQVRDLDGRVDSLSQKFRADHAELGNLGRRMDAVEKVAGALRGRLEAIEEGRRSEKEERRISLQLQQQQRREEHRLDDVNGKQEDLQQQQHQQQPTQRISRTLDTTPWHAQIIWVLSASRPNVFEVDGIAYLKLQSRTPSHRVTFTSPASLSFHLGIEGSFAHVLRGRAWMPLASHKTSENEELARITLDRLPMKMRDERLWSKSWLEEHCVTYDSTGKPHLYVALQEEELGLREIGAAPVGAAAQEGKRRDGQVQEGKRRDSLLHQAGEGEGTYFSNRHSVHAADGHTPGAATRQHRPLEAASTATTPLDPSVRHTSQPYTQSTTYPQTQSAPLTARTSYTDFALATPHTHPLSPSPDPPMTPNGTHPAFRPPSRAHSLHLQALPPFNSTPTQPDAFLTPTEAALLSHNPQPGLTPILGGGTDEAGSVASESVGGVRRGQSLRMRLAGKSAGGGDGGKDERGGAGEGLGILNRPRHSARASLTGQSRSHSQGANVRLGVRASSAGAADPRSAPGVIGSHTPEAQAARDARSVNPATAGRSAQSSRPPSLNALSRYGSRDGGGCLLYTSPSPRD